MELRPYQQQAREAVERDWAGEYDRTLLVLPTGCGKTIVFCKIIEDMVRAGSRCLILAHRGELLEQAADKLLTAVGLGCAVEKAEESCLDSWYRVTVGSVQTLTREKRLARFPNDYFDVIVVDEAHHCLADSYQRVLGHFSGAKVLGVTATPDRGDMRDLGTYFQHLAYEYTMPQAIREGYLSPIKAVTIPLKLDLTGVGVQAGDFKSGDLDTALDPYLHQIAKEMVQYCVDRKTVVFLPLVRTSQKFRDILNAEGLRAAEVNGGSKDRTEILKDFAEDRYNVLCNSMLLTEGWDCPDVDCVVMLRPTKIRSLYCLDEQTEVLTPSGWKKDVSVGEYIAAFDPRTSEIKYVPALAKVRRKLDPDEYFCSIKGASTDIRVTNHHRMLYDNKRHTGWKFKEAQDLAALRDGIRIPVAGYGIFAGINLTDDEIKFIAWVMTNGSINKKNRQIQITQSSTQPWCEEIQKTIENCGFKYGRHIHNSESGFKRNGDNIIWTISKGEPRGRDSCLRGWGDLEPYLSKEFSPLLNDMTERQFEVFLNVCHLAHGHKQRSEGWTQRSYHLSSGNKIFLERLQIAAVQRGYRASFATNKNTNGNDIYTLHLKKQDFVCVGGKYDGRPTWTSEAHTDEMCWCAQTELGTLITRRNGKVAIMGNCQAIGRGTRISPGKDHLLLLDFLWHTERHELCHPASLICESPEVAQKMTESLEDNAGCPVDIEEAEQKAREDVVAQREEALAKQLAEMRTRKRRLVDPLQFEMSIQAEDLSGYVPSFGWEMGPPTEKQMEALANKGICPDEIENAGKASLLLDRLKKRSAEGLTTPRQIRVLENFGFQRVGQWRFEEASNMITRMAALAGGKKWRVPPGITPSAYVPASMGGG